MRKLIIVVAALLSACQSFPGRQLVALRNDGQAIEGNSQLMAQRENDRVICVGETQKIAGGAAPVYYQGIAGSLMAAAIVSQQEAAFMDVFKGCMAQLGYTIITVDMRTGKRVE
jgi:hypothetical protein